MPGGHLQTMGTRKKRVSSGELRISAQGEAGEMGTQGCHLSSSLPRLASAVQLSGMLCGALAPFGDHPTGKRAQKGSQSWGKPPHRQNTSAGIAGAREWGGAVHGSKAVAEITCNWVRKAVKPPNQVKQSKEEEQGRKFFYNWKSETSEDNILEEEGKIQTTCISNLAIIAMNSSLMKPDMGDPGIRAISWV